MTKVFVVILNWKRASDTVECLQSIEKLLIRNYKLEIVIVDNASGDNSIDLISKSLRSIESTKGIGISIIENRTNLGFAAGNNVGISYAIKNEADFILILNNDTIVDENLIVELLKTYKKYPKVGAISPKIYFAKGYEYHKDRYEKKDLGKVLWYAGGPIDWANVYGKTRGVDEVDRGQYGKTEDTDFATGTCMLLSKKVLEEVGLFDEKYFMYYEDTDLSVRIKRAGWRVLYAPSARIWHKVAQSSRIGSNLNDYFIHRNRLLFGMRYAPVRTKFALFRESIRFMLMGREYQKAGVTDYFMMRFGKGSWKAG